MNLLYSVLLCCFALCAATTIDATSVDWSRNWQWYPRNHPRRPPPPFDIPRPHHRVPIFRPISTANPESTATTPPVVLYKHDCDPCWPAWGVKSLCNSTSNTVCMPCPMGTWTPRHFHYRECEPCAKCGRGLYEELPCTSTRDTKCDSCSNAKVKITEDFMKKCDWRQLPGTVDPRELDLDDTRIDIEVFDFKSKELPDVKPDSQEFGSNEEDIDRRLQAEAEEDITVDDPEIDVDQPQEKKEDEKDVSKEQEEEWARIMEARRGARHEIAELSKRLEEQGRQAQQNEEDDDDDEDDVGLEIGRRILHPIRPLPQTMPGPERTIHVEPEDDIVRPNEPPVQNNYPPSYHTYPIDTLSHAGDTQRRKAIVLLVLTCAIVLSTIAFVACYVKEYCRRRGSSYNRVLVVNLTPEEREIVRQSAQALETMENPKKKYRGDHGYSAIVNQDPEACVCVTENPLEAYLNATDERHVAKESLVENEVQDDHHVHRR